MTHEHRGKGWHAIPLPGKIALIVLGSIAGIALLILACFIFMWLWNWIMPTVFRLPTIDLWQGIGIFILAKILFGGRGWTEARSDRKRARKLKEKMADAGEESGSEASPAD